MRGRGFTTEAIVLSRKNWGEADRILSVFTKHYGKLHLLAKSARLPKSRKRGHIEIFSHAKISIAETKGMGIITEAELIDSFMLLKGELKKSSVAYFFIEVIEKLTQEHEVNERLFDFLLDYLNRLSDSNNTKALRLAYIKEVLVLLGFWPKDRDMPEPDIVLESIAERKFFSIRIGKMVLK